RDRLHLERGAPPAQGTHGGRRASFFGIHSEARGGVIRRRLRAGAVCIALAGGAAGAEVAAAQVDTTVRRAPTATRDTAVRDTSRRDTTAARDTAPRFLPAFAVPLPAGPMPRGTRYSFPIDSLVFTNVRTLSDLLAHVPGVYVARGGYYGQAEYVMYGGRGPAGVEIYWDGVPYLPLGRDSSSSVSGGSRWRRSGGAAAWFWRPRCAGYSSPGRRRRPARASQGGIARGRGGRRTHR